MQVISHRLTTSWAIFVASAFPVATSIASQSGHEGPLLFQDRAIRVFLASHAISIMGGFSFGQRWTRRAYDTVARPFGHIMLLIRVGEHWQSSSLLRVRLGGWPSASFPDRRCRRVHVSARTTPTTRRLMSQPIPFSSPQHHRTSLRCRTASSSPWLCGVLRTFWLSLERELMSSVSLTCAMSSSCS